MIKCELKSPNHQISLGSWGDCNGSVCGRGGVQLRSVFCEHSSQHYRTTQNNCNKIDKPTDERECFKVH